MTAQAPAGVGDPVLNPGPVTMTVDAGGFLNLAGNEISLPSTATPPECNDDINNDTAVDNPGGGQQDLNVDFDGGPAATPPDAQCGAGGGNPASADDSEAKAGNQTRQYITLNGNVDADGNITIDQNDISFPPFYVYAQAAAGVIDLVPAATGDATGTIDPATGQVDLHVDWQLRVLQAFFKIDCLAQISMDLSTDPASPANGGSIPVTPVAYDTGTGNVTVSGNNFAVTPFVPGDPITRNTGVVTSGSTTFTDPSAPFAAGDVNKQIYIPGAGPGGTELATKITAFTNASTVTIQTAPSASINPATYTVQSSTPLLCDTVGGGFGVDPVTGAPAGSNAAQLAVTSTPAFQSGLSDDGVFGTVTDAGTTNPVGGIVVTLMEAYPSWAIVDTTTTDGSGNYSFAGVPDGDYAVKFFDGSATYKRTWYGSQESYSTSNTVTVTGGSAPPADQALDPMPGGRISGKVANAANQGLPGVQVLFYRVGSGYYTGVTSGPFGYYLVNGVPPGDYLVQFVDPSGTYQIQWYEFKWAGPNADPVTVGTNNTPRAPGLLVPLAPPGV